MERSETWWYTIFSCLTLILWKGQCAGSENMWREETGQARKDIYLLCVYILWWLKCYSLVNLQFHSRGTGLRLIVTSLAPTLSGKDFKWLETLMIDITVDKLDFFLMLYVIYECFVMCMTERWHATIVECLSRRIIWLALSFWKQILLIS